MAIPGLKIQLSSGVFYYNWVVDRGSHSLGAEHAEMALFHAQNIVTVILGKSLEGSHFVHY